MTRRTYFAVAAAAGLLATGLIATSFVGARADEPAPPQAPARSATPLLSGIPQQGAALGRPYAPVTLVEFADLQCPYCSAWGRHLASAKASATRLGVRGTPSFAAGRTGAALQPVEVTSLDASALRPALDSLLAR